MSTDFRIPFSVGMLTTLIGAYFDAYWHLQGLAAKEGFFTPAHGVLYSGVTIMVLSVVFLRRGKLALPTSFSFRVKLALLTGCAIMIVGGTWDFAYHSIHGFVDVVAWTPPHLFTTAGFVVLMITGIVALTKNSSIPIKLAFLSSVLLFVALWTTVIYLTLQ